MPVIVPDGAQPERTALAWQRTLLGVVLGALLLAMTAARAGVPAATVGAAALGVYVTVRMVLRSPAATLRRGTVGSPWPVLRRVVGVVVALGVLGAATAVVGAVRALSSTPGALTGVG
ncbi:DUF202 domain-containing protein [Sanguibacter suaedae]|uniref:DUF202 domain-containing protein n=1 Tax=Sanguibacter suaedae TaxID=2795737 RepID=A0A934I8N4_9MICO|nr:DUF202 domain-containing protein [Sanguibacter suaedae]MBI9115157.1 DUF202 domain-containing protein [Sanguibacter suaedae]